MRNSYAYQKYTHIKKRTQTLKESHGNLSFEERISFIKEQPLTEHKSKAMAVFWRRSYNMARVLNVSWSANGSNSMEIKDKEESVMVQKRFTKTKTPSTNCHTTPGQDTISSLGQDAIDDRSKPKCVVSKRKWRPAYKCEQQIIHSLLSLLSHPWKP